MELEEIIDKTRRFLEVYGAYRFLPIIPIGDRLYTLEDLAYNRIPAPPEEILQAVSNLLNEDYLDTVAEQGIIAYFESIKDKPYRIATFQFPEKSAWTIREFLEELKRKTPVGQAFLEGAKEMVKEMVKRWIAYE